MLPARYDDDDDDVVVYCPRNGSIASVMFDRL